MQALRSPALEARPEALCAALFDQHACFCQFFYRVLIKTVFGQNLAGVRGKLRWR